MGPMSVQTRRGSIAAIMFLSTFSTAALAQDSKPSGSVTVHQVQVVRSSASGTSGGGTLRFQGRNYSFKLSEDWGIGGIGVSRIDATGSALQSQQTRGFQRRLWPGARSAGRRPVRQGAICGCENSNGVYLRLRAQRKGLALSLGADGMVINLGS